MNRHSLKILLLALGCTTLLSACLPEDKDPNATAEATGSSNETGGYYGAALGNAALQIQNSVVSDASWFENITAGQSLDLAAMNIDMQGLPAAIKSHICPTGNASEIMQVTWLDGRNDEGQFALKGIGQDNTNIMGALRSRVSADQLGTYTGEHRLALSNNETTALPSSCANLDIPEGAPVITFRIARPAAPATELARTEYRSVDCESAGGTEQTGARVQKRVVTYGIDGLISPTDPEIGWADEDMGECINSVNVATQTSQESHNMQGTLDTFANMALKTILEAQIRQMNCKTSTVSAENLSRDGQGSASRTEKSIDTCGDGLTVTGKGTVDEMGGTKDDDTKTLSCKATVPSTVSVPAQAQFGGINANNYGSSIVWTGTADLVRDRNASTVNGTANQIQVAKWIGKPNAVFCNATDTTVINCQSISTAPALITRPAQKWVNNTRAIDRTPMTASSSHYVWGGTVVFRGDYAGDVGDQWNCEGSHDNLGADCLTSSWIYSTLVDPSYLNDTTATVTGGVTGVKNIEAHDWENAQVFKPKITSPGTWAITGVACEWSKREPTAECPDLMASDTRTGNWTPEVLVLEDPFPKAMSGVGLNYGMREDAPRKSGGGNSSWTRSLSRQAQTVAHLRRSTQAEYDRLLAAGHYVTEVVRPYQRYFTCVWGWLPWGCTWDGGSYTVDSAIRVGPGADTKFLKAWRSGNTQTTLLNTDGIRIRKFGREYEPNKVRVEEPADWSRYIDPVQCGTGTTVTENRPGRYNDRYWGCVDQDCFWFICWCAREGWIDNWKDTVVRISGTRIREWRSDRGHSALVERYTSSPNLGSWTRYGDIPASFRY